MMFAKNTAIVVGLTVAVAAMAADDYRQIIENDLGKCAPGKGPAVLVTVTDVQNDSGKVRVQVYRGTKDEWLVKGRWLNRIEMPAREGSMEFCLPVPEPGSFAIAARHDANDNGKTDLRTDGGAMSNNPSLHIFNMGKPRVKKTRIEIGPEVSAITIRMKYF